jgi:steroid 5-alpha reductase family enzyme
MAEGSEHERDEVSRGRAAAFVWVALAYLVAAGAAVVLGLALERLHPIWIALLADLLATAVIFGFSLAFDNSSFYDPYWSLVPIGIAAFWAFWPSGLVGAPLRVGLVLGLIGLWGLRLTWNWIRGWSGLDHEDWRYVDIRRRTGRWYWPASFAGIHLFPTLMVFGSMISVWPALTTPRPVGWLDGLAAAVTLGAILIELTADRQLRLFRRSQPPREAVLEHGLWRWSRHPNYFGEIAFWWGLFLFALAADPAWWPAVAGPVSMTLMFVFISLPMIDRRMLARRPGYAERLRRVSAIVPWPPRG